MSTSHLEKRRSLEEKTKILEEKARVAKLSIDKQLLDEILQEENRTHEAAIKELGEKIANVERQMKPSFTAEDIPSEMPLEPAQKTPEPVQEVSDNVKEDESEGVLLERARALAEEPDNSYVQREVEAPQEPTKKKKRNLF